MNADAGDVLRTLRDFGGNADVERIARVMRMGRYRVVLALDALREGGLARQHTFGMASWMAVDTKDGAR